MPSSTLGRWPLGGARRLRGAIPRPRGGSDGAATAAVVGDYIFGLDEQPAAAELAPNRLPDAAGGFRWSLRWRTNIMRGANGREQRVATLPTPRQRFDGVFLLDDADSRVIRQLLSANPAGLYELPLPHEAVSAAVDVIGGTIFVDATYVGWAQPGRRLYVRGPAGDAYTTTITGASGGTINVSNSPPVGGVFPAGATMIYPVETIRLENGQAVGRYPVSLARWAFNGRAGGRAVAGTGVALTTYDGWTVLNRRPVQGATAGEAALGGVEFVDNGATMTSLTSWTRSRHRREAEWLVGSPAEREWWKAFLGERRGRWQPCLAPTWRPDLTLYEQPTAGTNTIRVTDDYLGEWWPSLAHRRLQLERAGNAVQYVTVDSVTQGSGYQELLLRDDIAAVPITKVSFLENVRLDSDEIAIEYGSGWRGRVSLPLCTVQEVLEAPVWPASSAEMTAAAGIGPWVSAWNGGASGGALTDLIGAVTMSPAGSPVYRRAGAMPGGMAWAFDEAGDRFEAASSATFDLGAADSLAFYACIRIDSTSAFHQIIAKSPHFGAQWYFATDGSGNPIAAIADGVTSTSLTISVNHIDGNWHDLVGGIQRIGSNTVLFLTTDLGTATVTSSSIGSMSNAQPFRFGGPAGSSCRYRCSFVAVATAGVGDIRNSAAQIIANMRTYTGRG